MTANQNQFDETVDVLVVGSGCGGLNSRIDCRHFKWCKSTGYREEPPHWGNECHLRRRYMDSR